MALCFKIVSTSATALISEVVADFGAWYSGGKGRCKALHPATGAGQARQGAQMSRRVPLLPYQRSRHYLVQLAYYVPGAFSDERGDASLMCEAGLKGVQRLWK
jgi:hypothetical protein